MLKLNYKTLPPEYHVRKGETYRTSTHLLVLVKNARPSALLRRLFKPYKCFPLDVDCEVLIFILSLSS